MKTNYIPQTQNDFLPSILPVDDEKYSNIKILDQKPIQYKDSPFQSRKEPRKDINNDVSSSFNQKSENDANSEFSEESHHTNNNNKNKKLNEMINYITEPYPITNKNYQKLKTQPNIQPKMNFNNNNNQNQQLVNTINQTNINQVIPQKYPQSNYQQQEIIYNYNDMIGYSQIPEKNNNTQPNQILNNNLNPEYYDTPNRVQHRIQNRKKNPEENNSKKLEEDKNKEKKHHHHKTRKIRVEIDKVEPNYNYRKEFQNDKNDLNESNLSNVSFSNKNIETNYYKNKKKRYNSEYNKLKSQIDPNILQQFKLIKEMESNKKIKELERQKEKLSRENKKLSKHVSNFAKEREKFEKEKQMFLESKERVINDTRKNEERLIKLENELQDKYMKKKNEIMEMKNKLKEEQNNLEQERFNMQANYRNTLQKLENDYKIKEETQNYNNNLNIDKAKKEQEILRQKENEINELKNNYLMRENNLKIKESELRNKEIDLQNKENDLNNKYQNLIQKEQNLMEEKERFINTTQENEKDFNMKSQELRYKEEQLMNMENQLMNRENQLKNKEYEIKNKEDIINNQENELNNKQNELAYKQNELNNKENEIFNHQNEINNKEKQLHMLNQEIQDKQNKIIELNNQYNNMISNKSSPQPKQNENINNMARGPQDFQVEARPSISVKKIQRNFNKNNIQNLPNNNMIINKVDTFGPISNSNKSSKNKDIKDNDDYPENNLEDIKDNDDYPENNLEDIKDKDNYPENFLNDVKDNDTFPENHLHDVQDNDDFPENHLHDVQDNDAFPENHLHDVQDNDAFPENQGKDNINNNFQENINNDIQKKPININPPQNQFNDDEEFYGENPNDFNNQPNKNIKNNDENEKNGHEEIFEEVANDFDEFINNQSNSQIPDNDNNNQLNASNNDKSIKDSKNNGNQLMGNQFPDNNLPNVGQMNPNNNIMNQKHSEENFSLDLSSKNNNLPPDFQENPDENKLNNNSQNLYNSNNIDQNKNNLNNLESGEIDLKNLHHEDENDINIDNDFEQENIEKEKEKDSEIDEIIEELYIEEYNPSLGLTKIENPKYLNAIIQCFAHIPDITDKIINLHIDQNFQNELPNLKLAKRYRNLLINLFFPEKVYNMNRQPYKPNSFMKTLYKLNPLFKDSENIELKEFINYLILKLHDELNTKKNNISSEPISDNLNKNVQTKSENDVLVEFLQNFTSKNNSLISKSLYGISKYTFYCHQCQQSYFNFQCYSYLYFNLNNIIEYKQNRYHREDVDLSINDCLEYYQKSETLRGDKGLFCPSCLEQTESTSIKNIYSTKNVIIFILDRDIGNNFNQCNFHFKESLNLRDYVEYKKEGEKNREKFFLGGVVNYIGDNYGNETYNAYIKMGKNNDWYCYDNENVYQTTFQDINNNGYPIVLFYHKMTQK